MRTAKPRLPGMTLQQVEGFVQLFERVSRHALGVLPAIAERTVTLDALRRPTGDSRG